MILDAVALRQQINERSAELRRITLRTKRSIDADLIGEYRSTFRGSGLNFSELREYAPGDDIKHIDWRSSARSGKTFVKSFEEERQLTVMLAVDTSSSTAAGIAGSMHQRALTFSSLLATLAAINGDLCGLMLFSSTVDLLIKPSNKKTQSQRIMRALSESTAAAATDIDGALKHLLTQMRKRSILFVLSDFYSPPFERSLTSSSRHHDTILVAPQFALTQIIPERGIVQVRDPESGSMMQIDAGNAKVRRALEERLSERRRELEQLARRTQCELLMLGDDPLAPLVQLMHRRHKRGI